MSEAILKLDGLELRTSDRATCRTLFRLMSTKVTEGDRGDMLGPPKLYRGDPKND